MVTQLRPHIPTTIDIATKGLWLTKKNVLKIKNKNQTNSFIEDNEKMKF